MDTPWWLAFAAVVLLALVTTVVDGWGRGRRPARRSAVRRAARPRPAEVWWARLPAEYAPGGRDRPCLVLAVRGRRALVAGIATGHREGRAGGIALPAGAVGDPRGRAGSLETAGPHEVPVREFRRRVGAVDPALWDQVRHLARWP